MLDLPPPDPILTIIHSILCQKPDLPQWVSYFLTGLSNAGGGGGGKETEVGKVRLNLQLPLLRCLKFAVIICQRSQFASVGLFQQGFSLGFWNSSLHLLLRTKGDNLLLALWCLSSLVVDLAPLIQLSYLSLPPVSYKNSDWFINIFHLQKF